MWDYSASVSNISVIQEKVVRTLCGAKYPEPCRPLFIHTKIRTIVNLYIYNTLIHT